MIAIANHPKMKKQPFTGFQVVEEECIWMKAGIINFRLCDNAYDCYNCPFDKGMQRSLGRDRKTDGEIQPADWAQQLKARYQGAERPCRYALTGRIEAPKICPLNYECYHCAFDQMMDDLDLAQDEEEEEPDCLIVSGYKVAEGYYYHFGHCWVCFEHGGRARIGFDDFIVKLLGTFQFVSLPPLGAVVKRDQVGLTFGRDEHQAASLSPVTGTILAVNHKVREHPEIIHEDPYHAGWLCILEPDMPKRNLKGLYFDNESFQWIEQESRKLLNLMGPEYEQLAATGAQPISDVFGSIPRLGWDRLVKTFLRT